MPRARAAALRLPWHRSRVRSTCERKHLVEGSRGQVGGRRSRAHRQPEVLGLHTVAGGQGGRRLEQVLQLAHVAGKVVLQQKLERAPGKRDLLLPETPAVQPNEVLCQHRDVLVALAQWRDGELHHAQTVVEVLPELSLRHHRLEVAIGGGDQPDVHPHALPTAHPLHLPVLHHPEQLGLQHGCEVGDLVEEQRAAVRELEPSRACRHPGRHSTLDAEQLGLEQRLRDRGAVERQERSGMAR